MTAPRIPTTKPALTVEQQIDRLRDRGMLIADKAQAAHALLHLNYYRLRGYWFVFETGPDQFAAGTTFEAVLALYDFDRRLRVEVMDAVERFEVSLRTHWAYVLAHLAGPSAYRDASLFTGNHERLLAGVERLYAERKEPYLLRYLDRNEEPPIWALCESMMLGDLSKWLSSIRRHPHRQRIADAYDLHETPFCSFVRHINYVRNVCAHHGRLWDRPLLINQLDFPARPAGLVAQLQPDPPQNRRVYNTLVLLAYVMRRTSPDSLWSARVADLLASRPDLWERMGVPQAWQKFELWQEQGA